MGRLQPRRTDRKQAESLESYPGRTTTWRATCSRSRTPSGRERGIGPPPTTPKTSSASTATVRRRRAAHLNDTAEYVYDGEGNRVRKITASETTTYVYDAFGRLAAEYSTAGPSGTAGSYFRTVDHLGTTRLVTNGSAAVHDRRDLFPFGEQIADSYSNRSSAGDYNDANPASAHLFTGKERDEESGLDYFGARYMASTLGRFTSVDPANAGAKPANPQSWNAYAYVQNGPLSAIDPDGRATLLLDQDTQTREEFIESVAVKAPESLQGAARFALDVLLPEPTDFGPLAIGGAGRRAAGSIGKRVALDANKLIDVEKLGQKALKGIEGKLVVTKQAFKELVGGSSVEKANKLLKKFGIKKDFSDPRPGVRSKTFEAAKEAGLSIPDAKVVSEASSIGAKVASRDRAVREFVEETTEHVD